MGLLSIVRKIKEKEKELRILILGLDNAGKTTILRKLCNQPTDTVEPTLGFNIQTLQYTPSTTTTITSIANAFATSTTTDSNANDNVNTNTCYNLNLWDVGGQKSIRAYWRNYFESTTDGVVWVVDGADVARLDLCKEELQTLLQQEKLAGASLLIFVNKQDIPASMSLEQIVEQLQLDTDPRYQARHTHVQGCSAKSGAGLIEGMNWLVNDIASRIYMLG